MESNKQELNLSHKESFKFEKKLSLLSHLDSVRDLVYLSKESILVSVSEDCLVKLWNIESIIKQPSEETTPYYNLRGHTDPIFTACYTDSSKGNFICTAGSKGTVHIWSVPKASKVTPYEITGGKNYQVLTFDAHKEAIWKILSHSASVRFE